MGAETVKCQHAIHYRNILLGCTSVAELDAVWANRLNGGINDLWWNFEGHYFGKELRNAYNDKRVVLGGGVNLGPY